MLDQGFKKEYELAFLVKNQDGESAVAGILKQFGVEVSYKSPLNEVRLSYPIKKSQQANFGFLHFSLAPDKAEKLLQALNMSPLVLRTLVVTPPVGKAEKAANRRAESRARLKPEENAVSPSVQGGVLSNEALEKKLEEILK